MTMRHFDILGVETHLYAESLKATSFFSCLLFLLFDFSEENNMQKQQVSGNIPDARCIEYVPTFGSNVW